MMSSKGPLAAVLLLPRALLTILHMSLVLPPRPRLEMNSSHVLAERALMCLLL